MSEKKQKSTAEQEFEAAAVRSESGKVRGYRAFSPDGHLVVLRPDAIRLAASVERGTFVEGLKPGWKLATEADEAKVAAESKKRDAERAEAAKKAAAAQKVAEAAAAKATEETAKAG